MEKCSEIFRRHLCRAKPAVLRLLKTANFFLPCLEAVLIDEVMCCLCVGGGGPGDKTVTYVLQTKLLHRSTHIKLNIIFLFCVTNDIMG